MNGLKKKRAMNTYLKEYRLRVTSTHSIHSSAGALVQHRFTSAPAPTLKG